LHPSDARGVQGSANGQGAESGAAAVDAADGVDAAQPRGSVGKILRDEDLFGANFFFLLFDAETACPLAQFEANCLGQIRTGAASGYATDVLAARDASTLTIIGSGFQAQAQFEAIREVRAIKSVRVWSRNDEKREKFANLIGATACATAEHALRGADIVATATSAKDPVLESAWIAAGTHIMLWDRTRRRGANCPRT
jgi:ornithine cyclodeaminase/alanine dehydrogenase-like protein (mu-crystallin family)